MISEQLVDLSRLQFAATAMYHFLFVPLTLGMVWILAFPVAKMVIVGNKDAIKKLLDAVVTALDAIVLAVDTAIDDAIDQAAAPAPAPAVPAAPTEPKP